jgi:hypothetical protein
LFCFRLKILSSGGEKGIRTLETIAGLLAFQASQFNHSCTSPRRRVSQKYKLNSTKKKNSII